MGIFEKFKSGFKKSASAFTTGLRDIVVKKEIDDKTLDKIEDYLIQSDVGIVSASEIREIISQTKIDPNKDLTDEINNILKNYIISIMKPLENIEFFKKKEKLNATLISGVNGVGKTTTIGKISKILKGNGNKVMLAASDTFRAAAVEQLKTWGKRVGAQVVSGEEGGDSAAVAFRALELAKKEDIDIVIIDTAGRLQNKKDLMEELTKTCRVVSKLDQEAPHQKVVVLDGTVGQNAHSQLKSFDESIGLTGMIITKLDGSAKGGVVVSLAENYKIPIHAVGVGEGLDDLQIFEASSFSKALAGLDE